MLEVDTMSVHTSHLPGLLLPPQEHDPKNCQSLFSLPGDGLLCKLRSINLPGSHDGKLKRCGNRKLDCVLSTCLCTGVQYQETHSARVNIVLSTIFPRTPEAISSWYYVDCSLADIFQCEYAIVSAARKMDYEYNKKVLAYQSCKDVDVSVFVLIQLFGKLSSDSAKDSSSKICPAEPCYQILKYDLSMHVANFMAIDQKHKAECKNSLSMTSETETCALISKGYFNSSKYQNTWQRQEKAHFKCTVYLKDEDAGRKANIVSHKPSSIFIIISRSFSLFKTEIKTIDSAKSGGHITVKHNVMYHLTILYTKKAMLINIRTVRRTISDDAEGNDVGTSTRVVTLRTHSNSTTTRLKALRHCSSCLSMIDSISTCLNSKIIVGCGHKFVDSSEGRKVKTTFLSYRGPHFLSFNDIRLRYCKNNCEELRSLIQCTNDEKELFNVFPCRNKYEELLSHFRCQHNSEEILSQVRCQHNSEEILSQVRCQHNSEEILSQVRCKHNNKERLRFFYSKSSIKIIITNCKYKQCKQALCSYFCCWNNKRELFYDVFCKVLGFLIGQDKSPDSNIIKVTNIISTAGYSDAVCYAWSFVKRIKSQFQVLHDSYIIRTKPTDACNSHPETGDGNSKASVHKKTKANSQICRRGGKIVNSVNNIAGTKTAFLNSVTCRKIKTRSETKEKDMICKSKGPQIQEKINFWKRLRCNIIKRLCLRFGSSRNGHIDVKSKKTDIITGKKGAVNSNHNKSRAVTGVAELSDQTQASALETDGSRVDSNQSKKSPRTTSVYLVGEDQESGLQEDESEDDTTDLEEEEDEVAEKSARIKSTIECMDSFLIIWHAGFLIMSLFLLAVGIVLRVYFSAIIERSVKSSANYVLYSHFVKLDKVPDELEFGNLTNVLGEALITLSALYIACVLCYMTFLLHRITFTIPVVAIVTGAIILTEVNIINIYMSPVSAANEEARKQLKERAEKEYAVGSTNPFSVTYDLISIWGHCCGIVDQYDFQNVILKYFIPTKGEQKTLQVPPTCCEPSFFEKGVEEVVECASTAEGIFSVGCYQEIYVWLRLYCNLFSIVVVLQLLDLCIHIILYKKHLTLLTLEERAR